MRGLRGLYRPAALLALVTTPAAAVDWKEVAWRASQAALVVAHSLDMGSSAGKYELNPILASRNHQFGRRGISIKVAIMGGTLAVEELVGRRSPKARPWIAAANFAQSITISRQVTRNLVIQRVPVRRTR